MKTTVSFPEIPQLLTELGNNEAAEQLLGEKAVNLGRIAKRNVKIPDGFVITSAAYEKYSEQNLISDELWDDIKKQLKDLEQRQLKFLGGHKAPLFLVLSATEPIPGVVGLGLNDASASQLAINTQSRELPFALFPKFIYSYSSLVYGIEPDDFESLFIDYCDANEYIFATDFKPYDWIYITKLFKSIFTKKTGKLFPQDTELQFRQCIEAMFKQYSTSNVSLFRQQTQKQTKFSICVQQFIFGDFDIDSYSSVLSTHNFETGVKEKMGMFAAFASLEDIIKEYKPSGPGMKIDKAFPDQETKTDDIMAKINEEFNMPMTVNIVSQSNSANVVSLYKSTTGFYTPFEIVQKSIADNIPKNEALKKKNEAQKQENAKEVKELSEENEQNKQKLKELQQQKNQIEQSIKISTPPPYVE